MKRILKENINTKVYWNKLLNKGEWGKERGAIYKKLYKYLPNSKNIIALDIGCATGHGIIALAKKLTNIKFEACDFSEKGIIGLLIYLYIIIYTLKLRNPLLTPSLLGFYITNIFSWPTVSTALVFWIMLAYLNYLEHEK